MQLTKQLRFMYHAAVAPIRGATHRDRLESFYGRQAEEYDDTRRDLLPGRAELIERLPLGAGAVWIDLGGGTGANLEVLGDRIGQLKKVIIVDLAEPLLRQARQRIRRHGWSNVVTVEDDVARLPLRLEECDVVTFSYALTMIPDWYAAIENAFRLLRPGGHLGVVDFYVSRKHPADGFRRHSGWTRSFWPWWFAHDNVFLNPDHVPYLHQLFQPIHFSEHRGAIRFVPMGRVPYYQFVGKK